jgi:formylglycine-generating enzyme
MTDFELYFPETDYRFPMVFVKGTGNGTYLFGTEDKISIVIKDFYISKYPVTQRLWENIIGHNPSHFIGVNRPVETVSFSDITRNNGFLDKLNSSRGSSYKLNSDTVFRLPSETEWEYAARGGTHWTDGFIFSGSDDSNSVAWYEQNSGKYFEPGILTKLKNTEKGTETHDVGLKLPNQLGIHDMCGNVWEWCQDYFHSDIQEIPKDGSPCVYESGDRVLRGGCHHNWDIHCTVSKRYEIFPEAKDECIGFRIAASV